MKTIRLIGSLLLVLFQVSLLRAQTISPGELNSASGTTSTPLSGMHLEYTLGNPFQTSVVTLIISPTTTGARVAQDEDLAELPEELKSDIKVAKAGLKAWPIPSEGPVQLLLEGLESGTEAILIDQTGRTIQSFELHPNEPQELQLPQSGIYFIRTSNKEIPTVRLVKK